MANTREFNSSMSAPQSGHANLDITVGGNTTSYNPFGPDRSITIPAPVDVSKSGMASEGVSWNNKAFGDEWKTINTLGVQQYIQPIEGKGIIVRANVNIRSSGSQAYVTLRFRLADTGGNVLDDMYLDFPGNFNTYLPASLVFIAANPVAGQYSLQASVSSLLGVSDYVYVDGASTGNVKAICID